ncbi:MAG: hypothetical protein GQ559_10315, partial [Desulfobulbaceae bacterium]|nr:hypothetical protein [Desulfobulbaceae bacterium]
KSTQKKKQRFGNPAMLNADGYWLLAPNKDDEWCFMPGNKTSFADRHPDIRQQIKALKHETILVPEGLFTFITLSPLDLLHEPGKAAGSARGNQPTENTYQWILLSHVPREILNEQTALLLLFPWPLYLLILCAGGILFWFLVLRPKSFNVFYGNPSITYLAHFKQLLHHLL